LSSGILDKLVEHLACHEPDHVVLASIAEIDAVFIGPEEMIFTRMDGQLQPWIAVIQQPATAVAVVERFGTHQ
jgi:hypothetical protein